MPSSYLPVLLHLAVAIAMPLGLLTVSTLMGPRVRHRPKGEPYECGVPPIGSTRERTPLKFYRIAILFLIFDIEAAFLFPWAVLFKNKMGEWGTPFLILELFLFLIVIVAGYLFAWKRRALEWD